MIFHLLSGYFCEVLLLDICPVEICLPMQEEICRRMLIEILLAKYWKLPKYPSTLEWINNREFRWQNIIEKWDEWT